MDVGYFDFEIQNSVAAFEIAAAIARCYQDSGFLRLAAWCFVF